MAAVLCRGFGQLCSGIGECLVLPCKLCGVTTEALCDVFSSPFCPYLSVTYLLQAPVVFIFGIQGIIALIANNDAEDCKKGSMWLTINMLLSATHLIASLYMVYKIAHKEDHERYSTGGQPVMAVVTPVDTNSKVEEGKYYAANNSATATATKTSTSVIPTIQQSKSGADEETDRYSLQRVRVILCEDPWVALYIILFIVWIVYQTMGLSKLFTLQDSDAKICSDVKKWMSWSLGLDWMYMSLAVISFTCTLCCLGFK